MRGLFNSKLYFLSVYFVLVVGILLFGEEMIVLSREK